VEGEMPTYFFSIARHKIIKKSKRAKERGYGREGGGFGWGR